MMFDWFRRILSKEKKSEAAATVDADVNKVFFTAMTTKGNVRRINQDNLYVGESIQSAEDLVEFKCRGERALPALFVVCDGMGGERDGDKASEMAASEFLDLEESEGFSGLPEKTSEQVQAFFLDEIRKISKKIYDTLGGRAGISGCTVTMLYLETRRFFMINVGDSPGFLLRGGKAELLTTPDNRAFQLYQLGVITEEERWTHRTKSQLTQFLGMDPDEMDLSPHIYEGVWKEEDQFVIGSDGLTDGLRTDAIYQMVDQVLDPENTICLAEELGNASLKNGSRDNVTAITVRIKDQKKS